MHFLPQSGNDRARLGDYAGSALSLCIINNGLLIRFRSVNFVSDVELQLELWMLLMPRPSPPSDHGHAVMLKVGFRKSDWKAGL